MASRENPPTEVTGRTLIYDSGREGGRFLCSVCGREFETPDPAEAHHNFAVHVCRPARKQQKRAKKR
ncbi:MAG TPA: hypothetical protein VFI72_09850 [Candidatus Angelobacter sp.]|nr:hypothetical protein [Candidatus Angelobacter sp.]